MMCGRTVVVLILMFSVVDNVDISGSLSDFFENHVGLKNLVTNKAYLLVGETLTVQCDVTRHDGVTSDRLSFQREAIGTNWPPEKPRSLCFDDETILHPSPFSAVLNITATEDLAGVYYCYDTPGCEGREIGMSHDINVEYAPHEVKDFSCAVLNWDKMQCTWKDSVPYVNKDDIRVDLTYGLRRASLPCPTSAHNSCLWGEENFHFSNQYSISVTVTNIKRNISVHSTFTINANHIVKPDPVYELVATSSLDKPGCVHLEWKHSKKYRDKIFRVKAKRMGDKNRQVDDFMILADNLTAMTYNACEFPAFIHLNFSVETYPGGEAFSGSWSNPEYCSGWTPQEAPGSGPVIAPGSYVVNKSSDAKEHEITLYWRQVQESERNGIIDGYRLKTSEGKERTVSNESSSAVITFDNKSPFTVTIDAHNLAGFSNKPSIWHINPMTVKVPGNIQNSFVAKIVKDDLILYWNTGGQDVDVTVYWCYGSSPIGKCEKSLDWKHIENTTDSHYTIPRLTANSYKYYSYGLSVSKFNSDESSGIFWTQCLTRSTKPTPVTFTSDPLNSAVRVSWERHVCSYQSGFLLKHYTIKWCIKSECQDSTRVESEVIAPSNNTYVIENLEAGTEYQVTMETFSDDGQMEEAQWTDVVPLKEKSKTDPELITIVASILGAIALFVLVILICKCCCGRWKHAKGDKDFENINAHIKASAPSPSASSQTSISTGTRDSSSGSGCTTTTLMDGSNRGIFIADNNPLPLLPIAPCPTLKRHTAISTEEGSDHGLAGNTTDPVLESNDGFTNGHLSAEVPAGPDTGYAHITVVPYPGNTPITGRPHPGKTPITGGPCPDNTQITVGPDPGRTRVTGGLDTKQDDSCKIEMEVYSNKAFETSYNERQFTETNTPYVQDQNSWPLYHQVALTHSSIGTLSSSGLSIKSDEDDEKNVTQTIDSTNPKQDIKLLVAPCHSLPRINTSSVVKDNSLTNWLHAMSYDLTNGSQIEQNAENTNTAGNIQRNDPPVLHISSDAQSNGYLKNPPKESPNCNENLHNNVTKHDDYIPLPDRNASQSMSVSSFQNDAEDWLNDSDEDNDQNFVLSDFPEQGYIQLGCHDETPLCENRSSIPSDSLQNVPPSSTVYVQSTSPTFASNPDEEKLKNQKPLLQIDPSSVHELTADYNAVVGSVPVQEDRLNTN